MFLRDGKYKVYFADDIYIEIPAAIIFIAYVGQKLFGLFGGYGLEGTGQWMASIGLEPGYIMALMAGGAEFFGGLALLAISVALMFSGAGKLSADNYFAKKLA